MALFRRKRDDELVDPNDRSPKLGIKYKDLAVLNQLMQAGADLSEPRHTIYYLYFGSKDGASLAGDAARDRGFHTELRDPRPEYPDQWSLVCEAHSVVLDLPTVRDNDNFFEALAQRHSAEYDGWEASA